MTRDARGIFPSGVALTLLIAIRTPIVYDDGPSGNSFLSKSAHISSRESCEIAAGPASSPKRLLAMQDFRSSAPTIASSMVSAAIMRRYVTGDSIAIDNPFGALHPRVPSSIRTIAVGIDVQHTNNLGAPIKGQNVGHEMYPRE